MCWFFVVDDVVVFMDVVIDVVVDVVDYLCCCRIMLGFNKLVMLLLLVSLLIFLIS